MSRAVRYVETSAAQMIRTALSIATKFRFPVLAVGAVGVGKTAALRQLKAEGAAAYWEVTQHTKGVKPMFLKLLDAYHIMPYHQFTYELGDQVRRNLEGNRLPLLVDEYQNLAPIVLRELLSVQERCGFPLLLAGNRERLASTKRDKGAMEQIESPIGAVFHIGLPTREDCINIGVEYNVEGRDAYEAIANFGQNTSLRRLCFLLDICVAATGGVGSLSLQRIETTLRDHSGRDAVKLLAA